MKFKELYAIVLKNPDGSHEVVSVIDDSDELRIKNYIEQENCKIIAQCDSTSTADEYIDKHNLKRAYYEK